MRDMTFIIQKTARQLKLPEDTVNNIIRSCTEDISEFMSQKQGYSIMFPRVGRFEFKVACLDDFVERKRSYKAHWQVIGTHEGINKRTLDAANRNINVANLHIERGLIIADEFRRIHAKYYKSKRHYFEKNNQADITRLAEYLDVSVLAQTAKESGKISPFDLRTMQDPPKGP